MPPIMAACTAAAFALNGMFWLVPVMVSPTSSKSNWNVPPVGSPVTASDWISLFCRFVLLTTSEATSC